MADTVETLLDAGEKGLRARGYHAVSFRDLAEELGIKSSSVHYYFRQKEDLGLALVKRYTARFFEALNANTQDAATTNERIAVYCDAYRQALMTDDQICLCGMLGAESKGLPPTVAEVVAGFFAANLRWLETAMPDSMPGQAKQSAAAHVLAALQGALVITSSLGDHQIFEDVVENLTDGRFD